MIYVNTHKQKIKFFLVFFCALVLMRCGKTDANPSFKIHYENQKAKSVSFVSSDDSEAYAVFVKGVIKTPMLGAFRKASDTIVFEPAIPFSNGQSYEIRKDSKTLFEFTIASKVGATPELVAIYPSKDSVPENILKMYFVFSKPMQEVGKMLDYITVYNATDDRVESSFLELENELWNTEHTQLTLWLDPGRIKRNLIPNQEKGLPIEQGKEYEITVSADLKSADGLPLKQSYSKTLYVTERDTESPKLKNWAIQTPKAGTKEAVTIHFQESLDAVLAKEIFQILNHEKQVVKGRYQLNHNESQLAFYPDTNWAKDKYQLTIDPILEDLAGNNLNRLFDETLSQEKTSDSATQAHELVFIVH